MRFSIQSTASALLLLAALSIQAQPFPEVESFVLEDASGEQVELPESQEGVGLYLFWASWCPYCRALMPHLQSIEDEFGDKVTVYALNFRDQQDPSEYLAERGFDFRLFPDADEVATQWGVHGTPGLFIVDPEGRVRFNLYEVMTENPPGFDELSHGQKAQRRAPFWAARVRETLDEVLAGQTSGE
ncbi:MAG: TlpA disulfide reductase family protein [Wenzhouxiangellaceae bacterium]|nr:TlpA disulfide reductase family protein [Wenzhouxiangellaceae bacterium]